MSDSSEGYPGVSESTKYQLPPEQDEMALEQPSTSCYPVQVQQSLPRWPKKAHSSLKVPQLSSQQLVQQWLEKNFKKPNENAKFLTPIKRQTKETSRKRKM